MKRAVVTRIVGGGINKEKGGKEKGSGKEKRIRGIGRWNWGEEQLSR